MSPHPNYTKYFIELTNINNYSIAIFQSKLFDSKEMAIKFARYLNKKFTLLDLDYDFYLMIQYSKGNHDINVERLGRALKVGADGNN